MGKFPFRRPRIISKKFPEIDSHIDSVTQSLDRFVFAYHSHVDKTLQKKHWLMGLSSLVLILVLGSFISQYGKADSTIFYPKTCLGGWINPRNAEGEPQTTSNSDPSQFNSGNSAVLTKNTNADIYCGNFQGNVDETTKPTKILVALSLTQGEELLLETNIQGESFASSSQEILDMASTTEVSFTLSGSSTEIGSSTIPEMSSSTIQSEAVATTSVPAPIDDAVTVLENVADFITGSINALFEGTKKEVQAETDTVVIPPPVPEESSPSQDSQPAQNTEPPVSQKKIFNHVVKIFFETVFAQEEGVSNEETLPLVTPQSEGALTETGNVPEVMKENEGADSTTQTLSEVEGFVSQETIEAASSTEVSSTTEELLSQIATTTLLTDGTSTESLPEDTAEFQNNFLEVLYTFDGYTWQSLGELNEISMKYRTFEIPVTASTSWEDMNQLQIKVASKKHLDENPTVYLDAIKVEVLYESTLAHSHPDFARDTILKDEIVDGIRIVTIINNETNQEEIWYMHVEEATSTEVTASTTPAITTVIVSSSTEPIMAPVATGTPEVEDAVGSTSTEATTTMPLIKPEISKNKWMKLDTKIPQGAGTKEVIEEIKKEEAKELEEKKPVMKPDFALDAIKKIQGTLLQAIVVHVKKEHGNELWVYNIVDDTEEKVGVGTTTSVSEKFPLGVKGGYLFWLSEDETKVYAYNLSEKVLFESLVPPFDGAEGKRAEVVFEGIEWKVIIGADGFSFYSPETGEVFSDENSEVAESFRRKLELDRLLDVQELNDLNLQTDRGISE